MLADTLRTQGVTLSSFVALDIEPIFGPLEGVARIGCEEDLLVFGPSNIELINGVGSVGLPVARRDVFLRFKSAGFVFASVIHPNAIVASYVTIGEGAQIMAGAIVQTGAQIGANSIVNTGAIIDHDSRVGDHTHIAPGAGVSGQVVIGKASHIGAGARVIQGKHIGSEAIVAAGAVVVSDVEAGSTVVGVPARNMKLSK